MENQENTIQFSRTRKLNLALIDPKFNYMSEEVSASLWYKVEPGSTSEEEDQRFQNDFNYIEELVNRRLDKQVEKIVQHYQEKAKSKKVTTQVAEEAFISCLRDMNITVPDGKTVEEIQNHFQTLLYQLAAGQEF